jgi:hypothetical protein
MIGAIASLVWLFFAAMAWVIVPALLLIAALAFILKAKMTARVLFLGALAVWLQRAFFSFFTG